MERFIVSLYLPQKFEEGNLKSSMERFIGNNQNNYATNLEI